MWSLTWECIEFEVFEILLHSHVLCLGKKNSEDSAQLEFLVRTSIEDFATWLEPLLGCQPQQHGQMYCVGAKGYCVQVIANKTNPCYDLALEVL
jgi:hypothetical protein